MLGLMERSWMKLVRLCPIIVAINSGIQTRRLKKIPSKASLLYALETPPSAGETEFCDMRAAWVSLESQIQIKIENLTVEHSLAYSRGIMGYNAEKHFSKAEKLRPAQSCSL